MLRNLTYRQKLKYLGIGSVILLIICYRFSISKTIGEYKKFKQYTSAGVPMKNDDQAFRDLQNKNHVLSQVMNKYFLDTVDQDKDILGVASHFCNDNNLQITEYKPYLMAHSDSIAIVSRSITVNGNFANCLRLVYHLETQTAVGRIGSVLFKSHTNPGTKEKTLFCTVIVQNIMRPSNEPN